MVGDDNHEMTIDRRELVKYSSILGLGGLLAGCSGGSDGNGDGGGNGTVGDGNGNGADGNGNGSDGDGSAENNVIRYVSQAGITTVDPMKANDRNSINMVQNTYDSLTYLSQEIPPEVIPWLAKDWEIADDNVTYTIFLEEEATFHNGDPVTAEDVVFSIERFMDLMQGSAWMWEGVLNPDQVEAIDETTVEIVTEQPFGPLMATFSFLYVVNKDQVQQHDENWLESNDAGSGAYELETRQVGENLELVRNEDWWGEWPDGTDFDEAHVDFVNEVATTVSKMRNGELDISPQGLPLDRAESLSQEDHLSLSNTGWHTFQWSMHNQREPFTDINVRKAIAYAFDYETAQNDIVFDEVPRLEGPMPKKLWGHNENVKVYEQDLEKAQEFLDKSDYTAEGMRTLTINVTAGFDYFEQHALLLQNSLSELGIDTEIQSTQWTRFTEMATQPENSPDFHSVWLIAPYPDPDALLMPSFYSNNHGTWKSVFWYENEEVDNLLLEARQAVDRQTREEKYAEVQRIISEDTPAIFVVNENVRRIVHERVEGFLDTGAWGHTLGFFNMSLNENWQS